MIREADLKREIGLAQNSSQCSHNKRATGAATVATDDSASCSEQPVFSSVRSRAELQFHVSHTRTKTHTPGSCVANSRHAIKNKMFILTCTHWIVGQPENSQDTPKMIVIGWPAPVLHCDWSNRVPIMRALNSLRQFGRDSTTQPVYCIKPLCVCVYIYIYISR